MILTCPECATSYFVDDGRIPPHGRKVKCTSCGHRWTAGPDGPIADEIPVEAAPEPIPPEPEVPAPAEEVAPEIEAVEAEPPPPLRRPAAAARRPTRTDSRSNLMIWAGVAALVIALIAGLIVFREQIVRLWPTSSAVYAGLGLDVAGGGLVLEEVKATPAFLAGRPVLAVTGAIRNLRDAPVDAPAVRLTLLNRAGQPVAAKIARPEDAAIPPHATRRFSVTLLDPPATARDLEVRFESGEHGARSSRKTGAVLTPAPAPAKPVAPTSAAPHVAAPPEAHATEPHAAESSHHAPPVDAAPAAPAHLSPAVATEHG